MLSLLAAACQPALNWREVRPAGAGVVALFPCKPEVEQRPGMGLAQCEAAGQRFALSWADVPDATQVGPALKAMPAALAAKLGVALPAGQALQVPGMTPMDEAAEHRLTARDGSSMRVAVFSSGGRVFQALVSGAADSAAVWESFRAGLAVEAAR